MPDADFLTVNDFEVLGVGGPRRRQLASHTDRLRLRLHRELVPANRLSFYEAILAETVQWLRPSAIIETQVAGDIAEALKDLLLTDFRRQFPKTTAELLKRGGKTLAPVEAYIEAFPWQGPLISDHFRYFGPFLKQQGVQPGLEPLAQTEWFKCWLEFADFGESKAFGGQLRWNPSLQLLRISETFPGLGLKRGLHVFYRDLSDQKIFQAILDAEEAQLLDMLEEQIPFTENRLLDLCPFPKKLSNLIDRSIILNS
jgi:hypothetical protein